MGDEKAMIATRTRPAMRLQAEELETRVMLAGTSFFGDPVLDPLASGGIFSTSSAGILTGSVFSTNGGFSGAGFPTGGGFLTHVGFPVVAAPTPNGSSSGESLPAGTELSNATNFPTGLPLSDGVALPNGAGSSGVGLPDASSVAEVLALGADPRSEALAGALSGGFKPAGDSAPDAASGVGQMEITTGANTVGATILPTSGYSSHSGGSGGPVHSHEEPTEEDDRQSPESDATPNVKTGLFEAGGRDADADVACSIVKEASGQ
jgi:hypothetical protein